MNWLFLLLFSVASLPHSETPGALNPEITQATIRLTICKSGFTSTIRPPASYTNKLKARQMAQLCIEGKPSDYEEDHRVPLELGGNPTDERNLWPEPWKGPYGAHQKDRLENSVRRDVCKGRLTLEQGREIFLGNWWTEYTKRFGKKK